MITLGADTLSFRFPEIGPSLERLTDALVQRKVVELVTHNRRRAMREIEQAERMSGTDVDALKALLAELTEGAIAEKLRIYILGVLLGIDYCGDRESSSNWSAELHVSFVRTLRIPDDGLIYNLPAGIGKFPIRHVDDFRSTVPEPWLRRGGVMFPMFQSEAMWIGFDGSYPFAVQIGSGKVNAVTGDAWSSSLQRTPQNYVVIPEQPWIDGFAVKKGVVRQFVAMPLGDGYTAEEQITGEAQFGGLQIEVFPMSAEAYFRAKTEELDSNLFEFLEDIFATRTKSGYYLYSMEESCSMGLGVGGEMRQEIYADPYVFDDWDHQSSLRCFVHLCNSLMWRQITAEQPPHPPLTAKEYEAAGIPWYDYYRDDLAVVGNSSQRELKSIKMIGESHGRSPLPDNSTIAPKRRVQFGNARRPDQPPEWSEQSNLSGKSFKVRLKAGLLTSVGLFAVGSTVLSSAAGPITEVGSIVLRLGIGVFWALLGLIIGLLIRENRARTFCIGSVICALVFIMIAVMNIPRFAKPVIALANSNIRGVKQIPVELRFGGIALTTVQILVPNEFKPASSLTELKIRDAELAHANARQKKPGTFVDWMVYNWDAKENLPWLFVCSQNSISSHQGRISRADWEQSKRFAEIQYGSNLKRLTSKIDSVVVRSLDNGKGSVQSLITSDPNIFTCVVNADLNLPSGMIDVWMGMKLLYVDNSLVTVYIYMPRDEVNALATLEDLLARVQPVVL